MTTYEIISLILLSINVTTMFMLIKGYLYETKVLRNTNEIMIRNEHVYRLDLERLGKERDDLKRTLSLLMKDRFDFTGLAINENGIQLLPRGWQKLFDQEIADAKN